MSCMILRRLAIPRGFSDQARNAQYPTLYLRYCALGRRQVGAREPGGNAVGVMLITRSILTNKAAAP